VTRSPDKLFKYCSAPTAAKILGNKTLRWSSPVVFGDPFELSHKTSINFDRDAILQSTIKLATAMIFASERPRGDTPLINAIRRWRDEERFSAPEEAETVLGELLSKMVDYRMDSLKKFHSQWVEYTRKIRVCCFSSRPDNTVSWDLFAAQHRGVCLRFQASNTAKTSEPKPVQYKNSRPVLATLKQQIDAILYNLPTAEPHFDELYSVKSPARKLEQEWRCFRQTNNESAGKDTDHWFDDYAFPAEDMTAVCFGIQTSEKDKKKIEDIVNKHFPAARCYQANMANGKYELEIQKL